MKNNRLLIESVFRPHGGCPYRCVSSKQTDITGYKRQAAKLNKHSETFCIAAKRLHVMTKPEFIEFVQKKIMDKETK